MKPIIPTIIKRIERKDFNLKWAYLRENKDGDWHPHTGEIRLHWNAPRPIQVFIHEALHDLFPQASERWIWQRTYGVERRLTKRQREKILTFLRRTMPKKSARYTRTYIDNPVN